MNTKLDRWFALGNEDEIPSPALLMYPSRVDDNVRQMIALAGGTARLRPHMKTHKLRELIRLQIELGIEKFKCATIAEAEMVASCGGQDILLAYQPVGPNVARLLELARCYPRTSFKTIVDDADALQALSNASIRSGGALEVLLDMDCGQHRSGVEPGPRALALYRQIAAQPGVRLGGLHAYDGHIHDADPHAREAACNAAFEPVLQFRKELEKMGLPVPIIVAGGTPTFPIHARHQDRECSPGTCVLWDAGYAANLPDLNFLPAAVLLTRVISKPGGNRLCLDLGHKALASENPHPRVVFPEIPDATAVNHSEEHLVIETRHAGDFKVGACVYGIPWHICPTVALHGDVVVVRDGRATDRWRVTARERRLSV